MYKQLRGGPVNSTSLPLQVQWTDLVVLNDALGETFYFSRNLIDSLEVGIACATSTSWTITDIQFLAFYDSYQAQVRTCGFRKNRAEWMDASGPSHRSHS